MRHRVWFVTGISRGLGKAIAQCAIGGGDFVVGTTRSGEAPADLPPQRLAVLKVDMRDTEGVASAVRAAADLKGRLDVLVNNAGYGLLGPVETASADEVGAVFETNVFGPIAAIRAALPIMRAQRSGHIINISSVAGMAPAPGTGIYSATKAALSAMSYSLAAELAPHGVRVTAVSPGSFRTEFLEPRSVRQTGQATTGYEETAEPTIDALLRKSLKQIGDPERAAAAIAEIVRAEADPLDLLLGSDALERVQSRGARFQADIQA
ncbi:SDR family NAD(P)-dependent oxidoreductase [Sphingomonas xinjiangensis]|uniref:NAD(P)-dependent dehydrogenase (Short-subunit alcohol dehydrogenase family) n=1 Tax=Sphingomonas xinjiangensis TaxID=643568 RepID=A0A840YS51_9SPHN|nr:SDR family NAD(P)-dependent oxidoreductase [Sphingomonas xinjiangensis]MBB5712506.1 NAD(P)-dependent dehydrogenase (short-subunit alcohol dehydrogenase family) [Sphingomonas xinjiangensis]